MAKKQEDYILETAGVRLGLLTKNKSCLWTNPYIKDVTWADSYHAVNSSRLLKPESLQKITIRAIPELQMGDLISWQGRYWRVYDIKSKLSPEVGFIQNKI